MSIEINDIKKLDYPYSHNLRGMAAVPVFVHTATGEKSNDVYCIVRGGDSVPDFFLWKLGCVSAKRASELPRMKTTFLQRWMSLNEIAHHVAKGNMIPEAISIAMAMIL